MDQAQGGGDIVWIVAFLVGQAPCDSTCSCEPHRCTRLPVTTAFPDSDQLQYHTRGNSFGVVLEA